MTSLPISTSAPQTAAASKQPANANDAGNLQDNQPFGEVLARQISDPAAKDVNANDKLASELLAQLGANTDDDNKIADVVATDAASTLPTDMLAAMLPQVMKTTNVSSANAPVSEVKVDRNAIDSTSDASKRGITTMKAETASTLPGTVISKTGMEAPAEKPAIETAVPTIVGAPVNRPSGGAELAAAVREAVNVSIQKPVAAAQSNAAVLASLQNSGASLAAPVIQQVQVTINTPVSQNKWSDEFSQKITWLASSGQNQTAELHLNPPQLGPLDVVIKVSGDQATAMFTSPHAAVREAVEMAMPKLRDMLADNGIMLGNTTVSDQAPRDQNQSNAQRTSGQTNNLQDSTPATSSTVRVSPIARHNGIVDTFA